MNPAIFYDNKFVSSFLFFMIVCNVWTTVNAYQILPKKLIIAGVCQNVEEAVPNTIHNIQRLGSHLEDYAVVIYENNSTDKTVALYKDWAATDLHVTFISEHLQKYQLPYARTEKIARARNILLSLLKDPQFKDFEYTLMVDLDFMSPWPIDEILNTINSSKEWDCVAANGIVSNKQYYDRYAFRDIQFPFGPELLSFGWWKHLKTSPLTFEGEDWIPVYSAFGGLAIYKTAIITQFTYSGTVTKDLKCYYETILPTLPVNHPHMKIYKEINGLSKVQLPWQIVFRENTPEFGRSKIPICCEHVTLHASMAIHGHGNFFVNPAMMIDYFR